MFLCVSCIWLHNKIIFSPPVQVESARRASETGPAPCPKPHKAKAMHSHRNFVCTTAPNMDIVKVSGNNIAHAVQTIAPAVHVQTQSICTVASRQLAAFSGA